MTVGTEEFPMNKWTLSACAIAAAAAGVVAIAADSTSVYPEGASNKEITPNCVAAPLSTVPSGPSWSFEVNTAGSNTPPAVVRGTFWRRPCATSGDAQLLLTFTVISGTPFVCGGLRLVLIQNTQQTNDVFLDTDPNNGILDSFCGSLLVPTTVVLNEFNSAFVFDDDSAFSFVYLAGTSASPNASVSVAGYDPADYGLPVLLQPISGKLSGSYFDPARNGEGVLVEAGQIGTRRVFFLTWYTYAGGLQRWLAGNVDYTSGTLELNVPLVLTSGGLFGAAFNPSQVIWTNWGSATVSFPTCTTMRFQWVENGGQVGTYHYQRMLEGLDGVSCP
jgi:hypothetical protein